MIYYPRMSGKATWSRVLNGNMAPDKVIERMYEEGYKVKAFYVDCPVKGEVPLGSIVLTEWNGKPAKWIGGVIFQKETEMWEDDEEDVEDEEEYTEPDEYDWETDVDDQDDADVEEE